MPFIVEDRRKIIDEFGLDKNMLGAIQHGDICYKYYVEMVRMWKDCPCWTTAHEIYHNVMLTTETHNRAIPHSDYDVSVAVNLAWQVFFQMYVMPYEKNKEQENGTI